MRSQLDNLWGRTAVILATGLGIGFFPLIPGTIGSLWGLPLVWTLKRAELPLIVDALIAGIIVLVGIPICSKAADRLGGKDPAQIVLDEIAAFPIVFFVVRVDLTTGLLGFFWFRFFDVLKPWPAKRLEKLPAGTGIMADDVAAGLYAAVALWGTVQLIGLK